MSNVIRQMVTLFDLPLPRTTLLLTIAGLILLFVLRRSGHCVFARYCWCIVLLLGWFWLQVTCPISWHTEFVSQNPQIATEQSLHGDLHSEGILKIPELRTVSMEPPAMPMSVNAISSAQAMPETTTKSHADPETSWNIAKALFVVWLIGILVVVTRWVFAYARFLLLLRRTVPADAESTAIWSDVLANRNLAPKSITMRFSNRLGPSLAWTPLGYRLVVPREIWNDLSLPAKSGILRHELEHYLRRDAWKSLAVRILALPHWFNPVAHIAVRKFDEAAECLCDEAAYADSPEGRRAFAETLLVLHESVERYVVFRPALWGNGLKYRITHLLNFEKRKELSPMRKFAILTIVALMFAAALIRIELVAREVTLENPTTETTETTTAATDSSDMVELRLTVVDEDNKTVPEALVQLRAFGGTFNENTFLDLGQTDSNGKINAQIPAAMVLPDTDLCCYQRKEGLLLRNGTVDLGLFAKNWKSPEPLEGKLYLIKVRRVTGVVMDAEDQPVAGAVVIASYANPIQNAMTDEKGHFELDVVSHQELDWIFAYKADVGGALIWPDHPQNEPLKFGENFDTLRRQWEENRNDGPFTIKLERREPITVKVVDPKGNPLEGILTTPSYLSLPNSLVIMWNFGQVFPQRTDKNGMITFDWLPIDNCDRVTFGAVGTNPRFDKEGKNNRYGYRNTDWIKNADNNNVVISLPTKVMVEGSVRYADGTPAWPGMRIEVSGKTASGGAGTTDYSGNFTFCRNADDVISVQPMCNTPRKMNVSVEAKRNIPIGDGKTPAPRFDFILEERN